MKPSRFSFFGRVFTSLIASGLIWFTAIGMDLDARGVSLIRLLSFQPFFYFFLVWPFVVVAGNSKLAMLRLLAWGITLGYYVLIPVFYAGRFFSGISQFFHDCHRVIRLMGIDGGILLCVWLMAFSTIQYMIWFPIKTAPRNSLVAGAPSKE